MEETRFRFVVLLIQVLFLATNACPNGWVQHDSSCYHISRETETWVSAMKTCELFGGELATIQSDREEQFVVNQLKIVNVGTHYWIGGTDLIVEGEWVWTKTGERITQGFWHPGEPDNANGQHCLVISTGSYHWDDLWCNHNAHYVCEQPVGGGQSILG